MKTHSLTENRQYNDNKPSVELLFETSFSKEIRILFKEGQIMKEHQTPFPIIVEIFEGKIDFGVNGQVLSLSKGDLIALEGGVPHDLKALEDSVVRLTLSKLDKVERVEQVAKHQ